MTQLPISSSSYEWRWSQRQASPLPQIWTLLDHVCDPEIPELSLWDLGVLTDITESADDLIVTITPTYSGCPALATMQADIASQLRQSGIDNFIIEERLSPSWSSDWISPAGRRKLNAYGIAAPKPCISCKGLPLDTGIACPRCHSTDTRMISEFGATACKALFQCRLCLEPFDYFKPI